MEYLVLFSSIVTPVVALLGIYYSHTKMRDGVKRLEIERNKFEAQFGQELSAEEAVKQLLECTQWKRRTFETIKYHIGGYEDDELRKLLIRAGAIRFQEDVETWGLISRNLDELEKETFTHDF